MIIVTSSRVDDSCNLVFVGDCLSFVLRCWSIVSDVGKVGKLFQAPRCLFQFVGM